MRQDYRIDLSCRDWKILPVTLAPFFLPLKQAAVDKYLNSALAADVSGVNQVLRSGDDSGSAQELDIAQSFLACAHVALLHSQSFVALRTASWQGAAKAGGQFGGRRM